MQQCDNVHVRFGNFTQQANIRFRVKLGKSATEIHGMLQQTYGNEATSQTKCFSGGIQTSEGAGVGAIR